MPPSDNRVFSICKAPLSVKEMSCLGCDTERRLDFGLAFRLIYGMDGI